MLRILEILWALARLPSYVSLYINWNLSLTAPAHARGAVLTYGIDQPLNSMHDFWVNGTSSLTSALLGSIQMRGRETLLLSNFSMV